MQTDECHSEATVEVGVRLVPVLCRRGQPAYPCQLIQAIQRRQRTHVATNLVLLGFIHCSPAVYISSASRSKTCIVNPYKQIPPRPCAKFLQS
jgi:hypothetical protein